jgi:HAD superfamily hydrolase (TIGR01509 family)
MLQALLWDVDGTLAETERDGHRVAFNLAFAELGLSWGWCERRYGELLAVTGGRERLLADMAQRPDAPRQPEAREALARALHVAKNQHYARLLAQGDVRPRPGVCETMAAAAAQGLRQVIVTTTSRSNVESLRQHVLGAHIARHVELAICGEDVALKKPDPEAYRLALARLGLAPEQALAVEDSPAGRAAAIAAGVPVCLWPSAYFPDAAAQLPPSAGWCHPAEQSLSLGALVRGHAGWCQQKSAGSHQSVS